MCTATWSQSERYRPRVLPNLTGLINPESPAVRAPLPPRLHPQIVGLGSSSVVRCSKSIRMNLIPSTLAHWPWLFSQIANVGNPGLIVTYRSRFETWKMSVEGWSESERTARWSRSDEAQLCEKQTKRWRSGRRKVN